MFLYVNFFCLLEELIDGAGMCTVSNSRAEIACFQFVSRRVFLMTREYLFDRKRTQTYALLLQIVYCIDSTDSSMRQQYVSCCCCDDVYTVAQEGISSGVHVPAVGKHEGASRAQCSVVTICNSEWSRSSIGIPNP